MGQGSHKNERNPCQGNKKSRCRLKVSMIRWVHYLQATIGPNQPSTSEAPLAKL